MREISVCNRRITINTAVVDSCCYATLYNMGEWRSCVKSRNVMFRFNELLQNHYKFVFQIYPCIIMHQFIVFCLWATCSLLTVQHYILAAALTFSSFSFLENCFSSCVFRCAWYWLWFYSILTSCCSQSQNNQYLRFQ